MNMSIPIPRAKVSSERTQPVNEATDKAAIGNDERRTGFESTLPL